MVASRSSKLFGERLEHSSNRIACLSCRYNVSQQSVVKRRLLLWLCSLVVLCGGLPLMNDSFAQTRGSNVVNVGPPSHRSVTVSAGSSRLYRYDVPIIRVSVADPTVADVVMINPNEAYLLGKKPGVTNIFLWHENQQTSVIDLTVQANIVDIRSVLSKLLPTEKALEVTAAGDSVVLSGQLSDPARVAQAMQIAEQISGGKKVMNMMRTDFLPQVLIEVKIAEIDKQLADELGIVVDGTDFFFSPAGGGGAALAGANVGFFLGDVQNWVRAQESTGLVKILAEPNIMAISGQEGNFLAGGIVFLPVPQSSGTGGGAVITLQEQTFGVGLKFTPTVLEGGRINLVVRPEVSEVSPQGIQVSSGASQLLMPLIRTRAASTTVQLMDGQTFAIGGLISNNVTESITAFPGLSNIPILGALFRSSSFQARRTELVILVTPRLVKPMDIVPSLPTDRFVQPTQAEFMLEGKMEGGRPPVTAAGSGEAIRIVQDYGY